MKKYLEPEMQFFQLNSEDIVCTSPVAFNDDPEGGVGVSVGYGSNLR